MQEAWLKGYKGEEREARIKEINSYRNAFEALSEILREEESTPDYDCPSWSHKQADQNGFNRAIRKVKTLLTLKET